MNRPILVAFAGVLVLGCVLGPDADTVREAELEASAPEHAAEVMALVDELDKAIQAEEPGMPSAVFQQAYDKLDDFSGMREQPTLITEARAAIELRRSFFRAREVYAAANSAIDDESFLLADKQLDEALAAIEQLGPPVGEFEAVAAVKAAIRDRKKQIEQQAAAQKQTSASPTPSSEGSKNATARLQNAVDVLIANAKRGGLSDNIDFLEEVSIENCKITTEVGPEWLLQGEVEKKQQIEQVMKAWVFVLAANNVECDVRVEVTVQDKVVGRRDTTGAWLK